MLAILMKSFSRVGFDRSADVGDDTLLLEMMTSTWCNEDGVACSKIGGVSSCMTRAVLAVQFRLAVACACL